MKKAYNLQIPDTIKLSEARVASSWGKYNGQTVTIDIDDFDIPPHWITEVDLTFPQEDERYYYYDRPYRNVKTSVFTIGNVYDENRVLLGNCYRTREEALDARDNDDHCIEIRKELIRANDGWVADYKNYNQPKWYINTYDHATTQVSINSSNYQQYNRYPAKSRLILQNICHKYSHKRVGRAFGIIS